MLGVFGIFFGLMGIFFWGLVFVPLGLLCTVLCFFNKQASLGLVSLVINLVAIVVSPSIWLLVLALIAWFGIDTSQLPAPPADSNLIHALQRVSVCNYG